MVSASRAVFQLLLVALVCHFCWTVHKDVQWQLMEQEWVDMKKISRCKLEYVQNRCSEGLRPALVQKCEEWWHCAQLDSHPSVHQMASLYATTLAQTLNSFVQALAFRTILLLLVLIYVSRHVL
ncbi:nucleus export protein BRR6 [Kluyveromyces marxianus]|uniref:Nucleus export protein BRR6 n=2 Tax=Kluyveromyces marxianus TaxID=4911 RepID=W0TF12_KLUMD|nr:nucleus export protein BRR6 [Kluyveromyces marxianus DMKU3-1042]QGN18356.1 nucleus export protein BRR6 [Kluyveromyces marxianus]BAO42227.1 nucleus export protein BRR6 [Kluyveromyces marxianus DMKU3-1042]BAP73625.1 nucleus export protein BRR6 [Kluyveromyces marxianus]